MNDLRAARLFGTERVMDDPRKVQHLIEVAERAASTVSDQTTAQRFVAFASELRDRLQNWQIARRRKHEIRARAYELWKAGKPTGREEEFRLAAERKIMETMRPPTEAALPSALSDEHLVLNLVRKRSQMGRQSVEQISLLLVGGEVANQLALRRVPSEFL
jgi:hypothetical protein